MYTYPNKRFFLISLPALIAIGMIPFDFFSFYGFRAILFKVILLLTFIILNFSRKLNSIAILSFLIIIYIFSLSKIGKSIDYLAAAIVFMIIAVWPVFIKIEVNRYIILDNLVNLYCYIAFFSSLSVVAQWFLYHVLGISFLNVNQYGASRAAFGFVWTDYSFLSLYLASTVFLVLFLKFSVSLKIVFVSFLVLASIFTSARTGPISLLVTSILWFFVAQLRGFRRGVIRPKILVLGGLGVLSLLAAVPLWGMLTGRPLSLQSVGRDSGNYYALMEFLSHPWFGVAFNLEHYMERYSGLIDARPHNALLEFALLGGVGFIFVAVIFVIMLYREAIYTRRIDFILSISCVLFGFLFIPSFFSAYFFATLLSFVLLAQRQGRDYAKRA